MTRNVFRWIDLGLLAAVLVLAVIWVWQVLRGRVPSRQNLLVFFSALLVATALDTIAPALGNSIAGRSVLGLAMLAMVAACVLTFREVRATWRAEMKKVKQL